MNRYNYCFNNPILYQDVDGHVPVLIPAAIGFLVAKAAALTISWGGIQAATHGMAAGGLVEKPKEFGNKAWAGVPEANRVVIQVAIETIPILDRTIDFVSTVSGRDPVGLHVNGQGKIVFFPKVDTLDRLATGLLAGNEYKYYILAQKYASKELVGISTGYDIAEAAYSIYDRAAKMDFQRAWRTPEIQTAFSSERESD